MQEVTFTLRTLTPLFLAGADQTKAELRAPTFRGLMRYWLRALLGGLTGTDKHGLEQVIEAETALFGNTKTASAIRIKVRTLTGMDRTEEFKREGSGRNVTGRDYLLWSMERFGGKPRRRYFIPGIQFEVTLSAQDILKLKQALATFWLLTQLGGIGSRSRRCAGSVLVQTVEGNISDLQFEIPSSIEDLQMRLKQGIDASRKLCNITPTSVRNATFDVLAPSVCSIWILCDTQHPWQTPKAAMDAIGASLQIYRRGISPLWRRKIFGLPLKDVSGKRRASPLLLRVTPIQPEKGRQYVGVAVLFKTTGTDPLGKTITIKEYDLIEDWIKTFSGKVPVTL